MNLSMKRKFLKNDQILKLLNLFYRDYFYPLLSSIVIFISFSFFVSEHVQMSTFFDKENCDLYGYMLNNEKYRLEGLIGHSVQDINKSIIDEYQNKSFKDSRPKQLVYYYNKQKLISKTNECIPENVVNFNTPGFYFDTCIINKHRNVLIEKIIIEKDLKYVFAKNITSELNNIFINYVRFSIDHEFQFSNKDIFSYKIVNLLNNNLFLEGKLSLLFRSKKYIIETMKTFLIFVLILLSCMILWIIKVRKKLKYINELIVLRLHNIGCTIKQNKLITFNIFCSLDKTILLLLKNSDEYVQEMIRYKNKIRQVLDSVNMGIVEIDLNNREIIDCNLYASKIIGISKEDIIGHKCYNTICSFDDHKKCYLENIKHSKLENDFTNMESIIVNKTTNEKINVISSIVKIISENEKLHIVESFVDIRELKLKEKELYDAKIESENSLRSRNIFISNVSHELRTPLTLIIGLSGLLLEDPNNLTYDVKMSLVDIHANATFLLRLINDILDVTKIESGDLKFQESEFSLQKLLDDVHSILKNTATSKGISFTIEFNSDVFDYLVISDFDRLKQVLLNITGNAIKFTNSGYVKIIVKIVKETSSYYQIEFEIEDTGIGISKENYKKIFLPFIQTDEGSSKKYSGTGLGLAISKKIIELLDSKINLSSVVGSGSLFTFILKLKKGRNIKDQNLLDEDRKEIVIWKNQILHILVVEDNVNTRRMIKKFLEKYQHIVTMCENGKSCLVKLRLDLYDIILMDLQMPEMDGIECTKIIRREEYKIPIVAFTASAFGDDIKKCLDSGMNDFISKPISNSITLQNKIGYVWEKNKLKSFDNQEALNYHDNNITFLQESLDIFKNSFSLNLNKLKEEYNKKNHKEIRRLAHTYKTDCQCLGFEKLRTIFYNIETISKQKSLSGIGLLILRIDEEFQHLKTLI